MVMGDEFLSFADHQKLLTEFVAECHEALDEAGLQRCEAHVAADWQGRATFVRNCMTTGKLPNGQPVVLSCQAQLPIPWLNEKPRSAKDLIRQAIMESEKVFTDMCAKARIFRVDVASYSERQSQVIETARALPKNGNRPSRIVMP